MRQEGRCFLPTPEGRGLRAECLMTGRRGQNRRWVFGCREKIRAHPGVRVDHRGDAEGGVGRRFVAPRSPISWPKPQNTAFLTGVTAGGGVNAVMIDRARPRNRRSWRALFRRHHSRHARSWCRSRSGGLRRCRGCGSGHGLCRTDVQLLPVALVLSAAGEPPEAPIAVIRRACRTDRPQHCSGGAWRRVAAACLQQSAPGVCGLCQRAAHDRNDP